MTNRISPAISATWMMPVVTFKARQTIQTTIKSEPKNHSMVKPPLRKVGFPERHGLPGRSGGGFERLARLSLSRRGG